MANMRIEYASPFKKKFNKAPAKIQRAFMERGKIFESDPYHPLLNNHKLGGKYEGYRSINITGDWRAVFREFNNYSLVSFETLGTHSQLYK
jgi:addiction module RelE/StbE family toxin